MKASSYFIGQICETPISFTCSRSQCSIKRGLCLVGYRSSNTPVIVCCNWFGFLFHGINFLYRLEEEILSRNRRNYFKML